MQFESLVNLEGCKTKIPRNTIDKEFESLVNLEGCKTLSESMLFVLCLRVLLI